MGTADEVPLLSPFSTSIGFSSPSFPLSSSLLLSHDHIQPPHFWTVAPLGDQTSISLLKALCLFLFVCLCFSIESRCQIKNTGPYRVTTQQQLQWIWITNYPFFDSQHKACMFRKAPLGVAPGSLKSNSRSLSACVIWISSLSLLESRGQTKQVLKSPLVRDTCEGWCHDDCWSKHKSEFIINFLDYLFSNRSQ